MVRRIPWEFLPSLRSAGPEFLADAVDKKFHPAAPRAHINVKMFPVREELAQVSQPESPAPAAFVEFFCSDILKAGLAARTDDRVRFMFVSHGHFSFLAFCILSYFLTKPFLPD